MRTHNQKLRAILKIVHSYNKYHKDFNSEKDESNTLESIKEIILKEGL